MEYRPNTKRAEGVRHQNFGRNPNQIMIPEHTRVPRYVRPLAESAPIFYARLTPKEQKQVSRFAPQSNSAPLPRGKVVR